MFGVLCLAVGMKHQTEFPFPVRGQKVRIGVLRPDPPRSFAEMARVQGGLEPMRVTRSSIAILISAGLLGVSHSVHPASGEEPPKSKPASLHDDFETPGIA